MSAPTPSPTSSRRRGPVARTATRLVRQQSALAVWYWAIVLLVVAVVPFVILRFVPVETSVLTFARQAGIWFPFSLHVLLATTYLPVHVASGMTRRSYVRGTLANAVIMAFGYAALTTVGLQLERLWHDAMGWSWSLDFDPFGQPGGAPLLILLDYAVVFAIGNLCGLLVGTVYYAAGGWWVTLTLPLTVGPLVLTFLLLPAGVGALPLGDWVGVAPGTAGAVTATALVVVLLAVAVATVFRALAVRVAIAPRSG